MKYVIIHMGGDIMIVYEPAGRAREYAPLAANLYRGCGHGCVYCYAPDAIRERRETFYNKPIPRKNIIAELEKDCAKLDGKETRPVLLSFTSDPYQPLDEKLKIAREAIKILKKHGLNVVILTKGGKRAERDFDLLDSGDFVGASLTFTNVDDSKKWEPHAALPEERIAMLRNAKEAGLKTWASLEPVIYPEQSLELIRLTHEFVDLYKVGTLNHHSHAKSIDWKSFAERAIAMLKEYGVKFYIKKDLRKYLEVKECLQKQ
jgi:DNA repair photolyase